jgi:tetratricopeptide (TPR) repeat protein
MTLKYRSILAVCLLALGAAVQAAAENVSVDFNNAGVEAYNLGEYDTAIGYFEKAQAGGGDKEVVGRNLCNAHQNLAGELAKKGDFRAAARHADSAAAVDPKNMSPLVQAGAYYLRLDEVNMAIERLEKAITVKPGELTAHEMLGYAYYRDNDLSSARAQWDYVLEMDPKRPELQERYDKAFREQSVENDFDKYKSRHFQVSYPAEIPNDLRAKVIGILDRAYIDIGRDFGGVFPPPPIHVILYDAKQFSEATKTADYVGALYDGKIRSPLADASGAWLPVDEIRRRLTHEYVHVVVKHIAGGNPPWWVNEGLAETLSRPLDSERIHALQKLYREGAPEALKSLETTHLARMDKDAVGLAYLQSHATVDTLWSRYGRGKMVMLLEAVGRGQNVEDALREVYRKTYVSIERDVANNYR